MLSVGLNALHLVPGETGGSELYARRLVAALSALEEDAPRLVMFVPTEAVASVTAEPWAENVEIVRVPVRARSRVRRVLAEQTLLRGAVTKSGIDLLHNLFTTAPALPGVPQVTTIHDVIYKRIPEAHAGLLTYGMRVLVPLAARRSRRVITVSQAAKNDIVNLLGVPADKVDVTPNGPGLPLSTSPPTPVELRRRFDVGDAPLLLTVSAKLPHKNRARLFDAFARLEATAEPVLVVPGYATQFEDELRSHAASLGLDKRVRFTGWLDDATLDGLYRAADCFVFPSLAEGFGLPVLEAMVRGTPVVCSRIDPLVEVAADTALYFEPTDTQGLTRAIETILDDADLRRRLADAGRKRAKEFSWAKTAEATIASYERAVA